MKSIKVSTADFQASHGVRPRGRGHWAFFFGFSRTQGGTVDPWFAPANMLYSDAVRAAQAQAASRGFTHVQVGS
jgi:hypothetical protein